MLDWLWNDPRKIDLDRREILRLKEKYGSDAVEVVRKRASDRTLSARDRNHWRRLSRQL